MTNNTHMLSINNVLGAALLSLGLPALLGFAADPVISPSARQVLWYDSPPTCRSAPSRCSTISSVC
ncbi:MAG: hypothetical protein WCK89_11565, partial [bacterium]